MATTSTDIASTSKGPDALPSAPISSPAETTNKNNAATNSLGNALQDTNFGKAAESQFAQKPAPLGVNDGKKLDLTPVDPPKYNSINKLEYGYSYSGAPAEAGKTPEAKPAEAGKTPEAKPAEAGKTPEAKPAEAGKTPETEPPTQAKLDTLKVEAARQIGVASDALKSRDGAIGEVSKTEKQAKDAKETAEKAKTDFDSKSAESKKISDEVNGLKTIDDTAREDLRKAEENLSNASEKSDFLALSDIKDKALKVSNDASFQVEAKRAEFQTSFNEAKKLELASKSAELDRVGAEKAQAAALADKGAKEATYENELKKLGKSTLNVGETEKALSAAKGKEAAPAKAELATGAPNNGAAPAEAATGKPTTKTGTDTPSVPAPVEAKKSTPTPTTETSTSPKTPASSSEERDITSTLPDGTFRKLDDYTVLNATVLNGQSVSMVDGKNTIKIGGTMPTKEGELIQGSKGFINLEDDGATIHDTNLSSAEQKQIIEELGKNGITLKGGGKNYPSQPTLQKKNDNPSRSTINAPAPIQRTRAPEPRNSFRGRSEITSGKPPVTRRQHTEDEDVESASDFEPIANH